MGPSWGNKYIISHLQRELVIIDILFHKEKNKNLTLNHFQEDEEKIIKEDEKHIQEAVVVSC